MGIRADKSYSTKLYPSQQKVWNTAIGKTPTADALREAMKLYCEMRGISFPMYDTGGRGVARTGSNRHLPKRLDDVQIMDLKTWTDSCNRTYHQVTCPRCKKPRRLVHINESYVLAHCGIMQKIKV